MYTKRQVFRHIESNTLIDEQYNSSAHLLPLPRLLHQGPFTDASTICDLLSSEAWNPVERKAAFDYTGAIGIVVAGVNHMSHRESIGNRRAGAIHGAVARVAGVLINSGVGLSSESSGASGHIAMIRCSSDRAVSVSDGSC